MLFDSTLRKELARGFGATLVVILTIVITMMLIRVLGQAASGAVRSADVVLLMGYTALEPPADDAGVESVHRHRRDAWAHVPRQRDGDLVLQRRGADALHRAGACASSWPVLLVVAMLVLVVWPWGNQQQQRDARTL